MSVAGITVVSVAYPFAAVGPAAVGGAEQILSAIDRGLVLAGARSVVIACKGSVCCGELVAGPTADGVIGDRIRSETYPALRALVERVARDTGASLVHMHGVDFLDYLPGGNVPVVVTLHLPLSFYPPEALRPARPMTWVHGVSASQMRVASEGLTIAPITNGVPLDRLEPEPESKRRYVLALGRICPEKGFHFAVEAAKRARLPLLLAGKVFAYEAHLRYFKDVLTPMLGRGFRFIGPVGPSRKRRLLARARAVVVSSAVAETSSLVAMEALASGTPVIAFPVGALPDIVDHGLTGFLVDDVDAMAHAMGEASALAASACRAAAERRFGEVDMVGRYFALYERVGLSCENSCFP